jgi:hypothetical protein
MREHFRVAVRITKPFEARRAETATPDFWYWSDDE